MITEGDGVRLITAVLFAGQMMTPDKFFVAESCPGKEPTNFDFYLLGVCGVEVFHICVMTDGRSALWHRRLARGFGIAPRSIRKTAGETPAPQCWSLRGRSVNGAIKVWRGCE
jgi:hypothetical protein